jgi:hypothetical protein
MNAANVSTALKAQKRPLPKPGRKLSAAQARALANKQFAGALKSLAK